MNESKRYNFWPTPEQEKAALAPKLPWRGEPMQFSFCPQCVKGDGDVWPLDAWVSPSGEYRRDGWNCQDHGFMTHAEIAGYRSDLLRD